MVVPAPAKCKVLAMDLHPGGSFETQISEGGGEFVPHLSGCFLDIVEGERITLPMPCSGDGDRQSIPS